MLRLLSLLIIIFIGNLNLGISPASASSGLNCIFTNPCGCGCPDPVNDPDCLCPPYKKTADKKGCLNKSSPATWTPYYLFDCIETTNNSDFFDPKVMVRYQACNGIACWANSKALKWDGECVVWPSPYGFPPVRYCARLAVEGDDGYNDSRNIYIDNNGDVKPDPTYILSDGTQQQFSLPKLCVYLDPSGIETFLGDPIDINPLRSPFHHSNTVDPMIDLIVSALEQGLPLGDIIKNAIKNSNKNLIGSSISDSLVSAFDNLQTLLQGAGNDLLNAIASQFTLNKLVVKSLGCVNVPIAPGPERYCPFLSAPVTKPQVQKICPTQNDINGNTILINSTQLEPCVNANITNNLINNSVRIGYNNFLPICDSNHDPMNTDSCVIIKFDTIGNLNSPKIIHNTTFATSQKDIIPNCTSQGPQNGIPCALTKLTNSSFRIIYALKSGGSYISPLSSYVNDLKDCSDPTLAAGQACQLIWGINSGDFEDVQISFPSIENSYQNGPQIATANVNDNIGGNHTFAATIVRTPTTSSGIMQLPNQICIYEGTNLVGCIDRSQSIPKPSVYSCDSPQNTIACNSTYFSPKIVVSLKSGNNVTQGVIEVDNVNNLTFPTQLNLAGFDFSSFVTNDTYLLQPFDSPPAESSSTIFGNYLPSGQLPFDSSGNRKNNLQYTNGLEYLTGKYSLGGTKICLNGFKPATCSRSNSTNCVLTSLINNSQVNCSVFNNYINTYPGLKKCSATENSSCVIVNNMPGANGGSPINIRKCSANAIDYHCYDSNVTLCKLSFNASNRITPAYNGPGSEVLADNEYYDVTANSSYDANISAIRDKTATELGLCIPVPPLTCNAINATDGNTLANGYATWSSTNVGVEAQGICLPNYSSSNGQAVTRKCVIDFSTTTPKAVFSDIDSGNKCQASISPLNVQGTDSTSSNALTISPSVLSTSNGTNYLSQQFKIEHNNTSSSSKLLSYSFNISDITKIESFVANLRTTNSPSYIMVNNYIVYGSAGGGYYGNINIKLYLTNGTNTLQIFVRNNDDVSSKYNYTIKE